MKHFFSIPMELQIPFLPNLFIFFLFLYMMVKLLNRWRLGKNSTRKLPPGPWRLPLIGNMHQLLAGSLPHHIFRDLAKKYGPLMYLQLGEVSNIVVSSPEMAREVLITNGANFSGRPSLLGFSIMTYGHRDVATAPYGGYWRQLRKICTVELLSAKQVQSFRSIREEEVSTLVDFITSNEGSPVNLTKQFVTLTCGVTSKAAFGRKCKDQDAYLSFLKEFVKLLSCLNFSDLYPSIKMLQVITGLKHKYEKLFKQSDRIMQRILDDHKERMMVGTNREEEDLVTTLLRLQKNSDLEFPLSDIDIKGVILDMFTAGTETTSTTLNWAMTEIIRNPIVLKEAQKEVRTVFDKKKNVDETNTHELKYLKAIIKETLRLHPSLPLALPRESDEKCVISGYEIPAKARVIVNVWAIGRDPNHWREAERFLPERFLDSTIDLKGSNLEIIPFGAGRRICPGISFALPLLELCLAQLLYHFDWKLPNGMNHDDLDMTEEFGISLIKKEDLILIPTIHKH